MIVDLEDTFTMNHSNGRFVAKNSVALVIEWRLGVTTPGQGECGGIRFSQIGSSDLELSMDGLQERVDAFGNPKLSTIFGAIKPTLKNQVFTGKVGVHSLEALDEKRLPTFVIFLRDVIVPTLRSYRN